MFAADLDGDGFIDGEVAPQMHAGTYGSLTIDAAGNWTYTLDNANAAVQALPLGATMNDTVTVTAIDGTTHDIIVTITGTNDAAVIAGVDTGGVTEDGGAAAGRIRHPDHLRYRHRRRTVQHGTFGPTTIEHYGAYQLSVTPGGAYRVQQWD